MCHRVLHICRGASSEPFWTRRQPPTRGTGTSPRPSSTGGRGAAPSNFTRQLAAPDSELAQQMAKDPYNFEFLGLSGEVAERELENALTSWITETLQELGTCLVAGLLERAHEYNPDGSKPLLSRGCESSEGTPDWTSTLSETSTLSSSSAVASRTRKPSTITRRPAGGCSVHTSTS